MPDTILGPFTQTNQPGVGWVSDQGFGQTVFSQGGDKYAAIYNTKYFFLYDFDRCSGELNYLFQDYYNDSSAWGNGCAFSASGRFLYVATQKLVYQYDMLAGNIQSSKTIVAVYDGFTRPIPPLYTHFNQMRLAPDGKIYISADNGVDVFHVIQSPDSAGTLCNVIQHSFYLPGPQSTSVPNIPDYKLGALIGSGCDTILGIKNPEVNSQNQFTISPNPAHTTFTISTTAQLQNAQVEIYNVVGEKLYSEPLNNRASCIVHCALPPGIYFVTFQTNEGRVTRKLVKE